MLILVAAALALVGMLPSGEAGMGELYGLEDWEFVGYSCEPTSGENSVAASPRADIGGVTNLRANPAPLTPFFGEPEEDAFAVDAEGKFNGQPFNQYTDKDAVIGDPQTDGEFDAERVVSLGAGGWLLMEMGTPIEAANGPDLVIWESASGTNVPEGYCVFGSLEPAGPFYYIGFRPPASSDKSDDVNFDLDDSGNGRPGYTDFSGQSVVNYVLVLDSGQADAVIEVTFDVVREDEFTLTDVTFTDTTWEGEGRLVTRDWSIDGVPVSTAGEFMKSFGKASDHEVCLAVTDIDDAKGTACEIVQVLNRVPIVDFTTNPAIGERGSPVTFTDTSTDDDGDIVARLWEFHDGTTSTSLAPSHTYPSGGFYDVKLSITDDDGGTNFAIKQIEIHNDPPVALFSVEPHAQSTGNPVSFTDESTDPDGSIAGWLWDFGDGATSVLKNPQHSFTTLDTFTLTLTVFDNEGAQDTYTDAVAIDNLGPNASIQGPDSVPQGDLAVFRGSFTDDGTIEAKQWLVDDVGDGGDNGDVLERVFTQQGLHTIAFTVTDDDGGKATAIHVVDVLNRPPQATPIIVNNPGATRLPVSFDFASDDASDIIQWEWDFDDGTKSSDPRPKHAFSTVGPYQVSLRVTDAVGETTLETVAVAIGNQAPWPHMETAHPDGATAATVQFRDASTDDGSIVRREWTIQSQVYTDEVVTPPPFPSSTGKYPVTLEVEDNLGAIVRLTRFITPADLIDPTADPDEDGILSGSDNCPNFANPGQEDVDGDGVGDLCDQDRDGDGTPDSTDAFPDDSTEWADTDGDGMGDNVDTDDDNDGITDASELALGTNPLSNDSDGDGLQDAMELAIYSDPTDPSSPSAAPQNLRLVDSVLSWDASDQRATSYQIWRVRDGDSTLLGTLLPDARVFQDETAEAGDTYQIHTMHGDAIGGTSLAGPVPCQSSCHEPTGPGAWLPWIGGGLGILAAVLLLIRFLPSGEPNPWKP